MSAATLFARIRRFVLRLRRRAALRDAMHWMDEAKAYRRDAAECDARANAALNRATDIALVLNREDLRSSLGLVGSDA